MKFFRVTSIVCVYLALSPMSGLADAFVVTKAATASTIAEFIIREGEVLIDLEVGEDDQRQLKPLASPSGEDTGTGIAEWFQREFTLSADSMPLEGRILEVHREQRLVRDEITGDPLIDQPEDREAVIRIKLQYEMSSRPAVLTIAPPMQPGTEYPAASIGFMTYHDGLPVNDFRYLATEATLDLDWGDPWYSRFRHPNLKRQYDAPMSVFLYVEPFEVRKEIVLRPRDLQQWIDLGLENQDVILVEQQQTLKKNVVDFLSKQGDVLVDGETVTGKLDRIHFIHRSLRTTGIIEPPVDLDAHAATLGVIFVYPIDHLPKRVETNWDLFSEKIRTIPAVASDEAGGLPTQLSPEFPTLEWQNFLKNPTTPGMQMVAAPPVRHQWSIPIVSMVCGIVALVIFVIAARDFRSMSKPTLTTLILTLLVSFVAFPFFKLTVNDPFQKIPSMTEAEGAEILGSLLHNVYRSFDHHDESLIYDQLDKSIAGDLLTDVYLETRKSIEVKNQGGLRVSVKNVEIKDIEIMSGNQSEAMFRCRWRVSGSIGHWGHIHSRENEHLALIAISGQGGTWKITSMESLDEQALDPLADQQVPRS